MGIQARCAYRGRENRSARGQRMGPFRSRAVMGARSRSGTATRTNAVRPRPMVTLTLSKEAVARLAEMAKELGWSRSLIVDQLILERAARAK